MRVSYANAVWALVGERVCMSDETDLQGEKRRDVTRSKIVRHIVYNPDAPQGSPDTKIVQLHSSSTSSNAANQQRSAPLQVTFDRRELDQILRVYGFKVADGEWKDYAIDMLKDRAIFSVFRRANDIPLHCIEKNPKLAKKQGAYSVSGANGRILKRGHDLASVLKVLEKRPKLKVI